MWDGGVRHVASVESGPETDPVLADLELSRSLTIQWALVLLSFGGLFVLDEIVTDRALTSLEDRDVTVTRAATMAGCSVWDVANLALKRDVDWVGAEHLLSDLDIVD